MSCIITRNVVGAGDKIAKQNSDLHIIIILAQIPATV